MFNKKLLNNGMKETGTEATDRRKWSKEDNKMAILCYLQAKEGPNIGYRKRMHQYWKDYGLFDPEEQH